MKNAAGELISGQVIPMQSWEVLLCGAHPGYTSYEQFLRKQFRLQQNCTRAEGEAGAVRTGAAQRPVQR